MNKTSFLPTMAAILLIAMPRAHAVNDPLPRSTPEAQGISSQAILDFVEAVDKNSIRCTAS